MLSLLGLISSAVNVYIIILIVYIVLSLLIQFDIVNRSQKFVFVVFDSLEKLCEPALRPIRNGINKIIPGAMIDLSPIVLVLLLNFAVSLMWEMFV